MQLYSVFCLALFWFYNSPGMQLYGVCYVVMWSYYSPSGAVLEWLLSYVFQLKPRWSSFTVFAILYFCGSTIAQGISFSVWCQWCLALWHDFSREDAALQCFISSFVVRLYPRGSSFTLFTVLFCDSTVAWGMQLYSSLMSFCCLTIKDAALQCLTSCFVVRL